MFWCDRLSNRGGRCVAYIHTVPKASIFCFCHTWIVLIITIIVDHPFTIHSQLHSSIFIIHASPVCRSLIHRSISHCSDVLWIINHPSSIRLTQNDDRMPIHNRQHTSSLNHYWSHSRSSIRNQVSSIHPDPSFGMALVYRIYRIFTLWMNEQMNKWIEEMSLTGWIH